MVFFMLHGSLVVSYVWISRNTPGLCKWVPNWLGVLIVNIIAFGSSPLCPSDFAFRLIRLKSLQSVAHSCALAFLSNLRTVVSSLALSEVRRRIYQQFPTFTPEDIVPVPCHPDSVAMAYALRGAGDATAAK